MASKKITLSEIRKFIRQVLNEALLEAHYGDIAIYPTKGLKRGVSEEKGQSFDIFLDNPEVIKKMKETKMGKDGSMTSWAAEGPNSGEGTFNYKADTTQWEVWNHMNYVTITPEHRAHWYHGKAPGGLFKDEKGNYSKGSGVALPELKVDQFGFKIYKALLLEVGYIISDRNASPEVKSKIYRHLMQDGSLKWITYGGTGEGTDYDDIVIMNPNTVNVNDIKELYMSGKLIDFETRKHRTNGGEFRDNFPKTPPQPQLTKNKTI